MGQCVATNATEGSMSVYREHIVPPKSQEDFIRELAAEKKAQRPKAPPTPLPASIISSDSFMAPGKPLHCAPMEVYFA